jgi:AbrB family looped-hinge helix DNA binding protein
MRITIDRVGRIVIPKAIREALRLRGGESLEILERDGVIEIRSPQPEIDVIETADGPVATSRDAVPPLTDALVRDVLDQGRR